MNFLIFNPGRSYYNYAWMMETGDDSRESVKMQGCKNVEIDNSIFNNSLEYIARTGKKLDGIGIRVTFGGKAFDGPVFVTRNIIKKIEKLLLFAPLHIPPVLRLVENCQKSFVGIPIVLIFETSFFTNLPEREHLYAINENLADVGKLRRYGYHGIYHEAACNYVRRKQCIKNVSRIISICLESRSEIAAVAGMRPLMVTGGTTPLEGLPGETTCGELDPSVILTMAEKEGYGPEEIDAILTRQSGIKGMTGEKKTLEDLLCSDAKKDQLAKNVIRYRILLACGAAIAAMGGLDGIVFSGRYAHLGKLLGPWLKTQINLDPGTMKAPWEWIIFSESLERIMADQVLKKVLQYRCNDCAVSLETKTSNGDCLPVLIGQVT